MKSWRFHDFGNIENLQLEEIEIPEPGPGEALIKLEYAALNPADAFLVQGKYPRPGKPPFAVGRDGCGTIEKLGSESSRFLTGDRVVLLRSDVGVTREGTLAEYVTVPEESLALLPEGWTPQEGAAAPLVHLTAWQALVDEGGIAPGKNVLITGASGGVGTAALVQAKALGATVVALSRSEEKQARLRELGADHVFDPGEPYLQDRLREVLDGGRIDIAVENIAGPLLEKTLSTLNTKGRVCVVGILGGRMSEIDLGRILFKRVHIITIAVGNYSADEAQAAWEGIVQTLNKARKRPLIDRVFSFDQVPQAFEHLVGGHMGKIVVGPMQG